MSVRIGSGLSDQPDPLAGAAEAAGAVAAVLQGRPADLALVFVSGAHLDAAEETLAIVNEALAPAALIGCGAGGVLGAGRELESGTGISVWAAAFGGEGQARAFHATGSASELADLDEVSDAGAAIILTDPYSFSAEAALESFTATSPGMPVLGGLSSARTGQGAAALFLGDQVLDRGVVGVGLHGVEILPCVSQGAAPLGRELTITAAESNIIYELAGKPALETIEQVITELSPRERALIAGGLLIGLVIDSGQPEYEQGDFLVRGVLGADRNTGSVAVAATVHPGQIVRLHARDSRSAAEDLHRALALRLEAMAGALPAGALVFSCNGRGSAMFGDCDHDASAVAQELRGAPAGGFFAAGEIGPVGGRSFVHGFTATIAVFPG